MAGGTGAPTGVSLNVFTMSGTLFGIFADQSSDERLKFDIRPTPIDALETLKNIEVCSYSLHPQIAAWFAAEGKDNDTSAQLAQGAEPVLERALTMNRSPGNWALISLRPSCLPS